MYNIIPASDPNGRFSTSLDPHLLGHLGCSQFFRLLGLLGLLGRLQLLGLLGLLQVLSCNCCCNCCFASVVATVFCNCCCNCCLPLLLQLLFALVAGNCCYNWCFASVVATVVLQFFLQLLFATVVCNCYCNCCWQLFLQLLFAIVVCNCCWQLLLQMLFAIVVCNRNTQLQNTIAKQQVLKNIFETRPRTPPKGGTTKHREKALEASLADSPTRGHNRFSLKAIKNPYRPIGYAYHWGISTEFVCSMCSRNKFPIKNRIYKSDHVCHFWPLIRFLGLRIWPSGWLLVSESACEV